MAANVRQFHVKPGTIGYLILAWLGIGAVICAYLLGRMLFG